MILTIDTFNLSKPASLEEMTKVFQGTAPRYQGMPGLLAQELFCQ